MSRYRLHIYKLREIEEMYDNESGAYTELTELEKTKLQKIKLMGYRAYLYNIYADDFTTIINKFLQEYVDTLSETNVRISSQNKAYKINLSARVSNVEIETRQLELLKNNNYLSAFQFNTSADGRITKNALAVVNARTLHKENTATETKYFVTKKTFNNGNILKVTVEFDIGALGFRKSYVILRIKDNGFSQEIEIVEGFSDTVRTVVLANAGGERLFNRMTSIIDNLQSMLKEHIKLERIPKSYEPKMDILIDVENINFTTEYDLEVLKLLQKYPAHKKLGFAIYDIDLEKNLAGLIWNGINNDSRYLDISKCYKYGVINSWDYDTGRGVIRWMGTRSILPFEVSDIDSAFMNLPNLDV